VLVLAGVPVGTPQRCDRRSRDTRSVRINAGAATTDEGQRAVEGDTGTVGRSTWKAMNQDLGVICRGSAPVIQSTPLVLFVVG